MKKTTLLACGCFAIAATVLLMGCAAAQPDEKVQQIPRVTALAGKITAPAPVHRFRKPVRDERARLQTHLADECNRMAESLRAQDVSAQALTGTLPEEQKATAAEADTLETALDRLSAAARQGQIRDIRAAHKQALSAYSGVQRN